MAKPFLFHRLCHINNRPHPRFLFALPMMSQFYFLLFRLIFRSEMIIIRRFSGDIESGIEENVVKNKSEEENSARKRERNSVLGMQVAV
jgi:hypothetical protein